MKYLALALMAFAATAQAQDIGAAIHDPTGVLSDTPLTPIYQMPDTPVGAGSSLVLRLTDTAGDPIQILSVIVGQTAGSINSNPNFTVTGLVLNKTLSTGSSSFEDVTVSFAPLSQAAISGYLQVVFQVQANGCSLTSTDPASQCPSQTEALSTLNGNATAPQVLLTYMNAGTATVLQPNGSSPLNFGNVSTSGSNVIAFTLTNETGAALSVPAVSLQTQQFDSTAFALNQSALPATLAAGASGSFTITFAPGQTGLTSATLLVGTLPFPIAGTGEVVADIDALQISYVDSSGVRTLPQAATPIPLGQVVTGTNAPASLAFTVTNPATSWNAVSLSTLAATGVGFALTSAPTAPLSIAPGSSITFNVVFTPTTTGAYNGTLAIGTRTFSLSGSSIASATPAASLSVNISPLTSGQQATLSIQLASAAASSAIGELTMTFTPSVANISDDPAIVFTATNGRQLQVNVASGAQSATYNSNAAITFQTGTTAGTITFTLTFPNSAPVSQSFTVSGGVAQITSGSAVRQDPNLVVTITAFDNTYSAGKLSFTFFDLTGKAMTSAPLIVDATSAFHQYFTTDTKSGGSFSIQASFPVTGDITQVASVTVQITNSAGTASATEQFQ